MNHLTIDAHQLSKSYASTSTVVALEDVDLQVQPGEFVALLGPSGCGKSTLLNLIAGFEKPSSGRLLVDGQAVQAPGPERGVVFQEAALFPWLSVWDNVIFGPKTQGRDKKDYEQKAHEMLSIMGLEHFKDHLPIQLSGGMRQRVGIARILTMGSKVLLMDEPFGALDAQTRLSMQELLLSVWQKIKPTIVFVTHDIDEAIFLSDTVYVMSARPGRIQAKIKVEFERPRSVDLTASPAFNQMKLDILKQIRH
jgi:NitT/TauT family transport system ATP-binding protein